jgi:hypothetical protein
LFEQCFEHLKIFNHLNRIKDNYLSQFITFGVKIAFKKLSLHVFYAFYAPFQEQKEKIKRKMPALTNSDQ